MRIQIHSPGKNWGQKAVRFFSIPLKYFWNKIHQGTQKLSRKTKSNQTTFVSCFLHLKKMPSSTFDPFCIRKKIFYPKLPIRRPKFSSQLGQATLYFCLLTLKLSHWLNKNVAIRKSQAHLKLSKSVKVSNNRGKRNIGSNLFLGFVSAIMQQKGLHFSQWCGSVPVQYHLIRILIDTGIPFF